MSERKKEREASNPSRMLRNYIGGIKVEFDGDESDVM